MRLRVIVTRPSLQGEEQFEFLGESRVRLIAEDDECSYSEEYVIKQQSEGGLEIYPGTHTGLAFGTGELEENGVTVHVTGEAI